MVNVKLGEAIEGKGNIWTTKCSPTDYQPETLKRVLFKKSFKIDVTENFDDNLDEYELRIKFKFNNPLKDDEVEFDLSDIRIVIGVDDEEKFILIIPKSYQFDMDLHGYLERKRQKKIDRLKTDDIFIIGPRI